MRRGWRAVTEKVSQAEGAAKPPQDQRAQSILEGLTRSCSAGKASGKQDWSWRTEQPCGHRRNVWVSLERHQEARKLGSDLIEWPSTNLWLKGETGIWGKWECLEAQGAG